MTLPRFIAQRLLLTLPVLVGMSVLVFLLLRMVPGDPALVILGLRLRYSERSWSRRMKNLMRTTLMFCYVRW